MGGKRRKLRILFHLTALVSKEGEKKEREEMIRGWAPINFMRICAHILTDIMITSK